MFTSGELIKSCLIATAEKNVSRENKLNTTSLSMRIAAPRVEDVWNKINNQLKTSQMVSSGFP